MEKVEENGEKGYFAMHKFINEKRKYEFFDENEDDKIELSLGLSLNGKFGVDPMEEKRLKRSCSIANDFKFHGVATCQLVRTCSLPVETEEQWRKRKEVESLRRMEAKRKRMEKMKNVVKVVKKESANDENNGKCNCIYSYGEVCGGKHLASSGGSIGSSQGSGSSGVSDLESQPPIQGPSDGTEARTPASGKSPENLPQANGQSPKNLPQANGQSPEHENKSITTAPETTIEKSLVASGTMGKEAKEMLRNFMLNMPCVSTKGDGPNGKKIEGFLYGYKKGEEVRILCVCHGSFLSPAEFVKHAGGSDVAHPLRHIVINPSPLL